MSVESPTPIDTNVIPEGEFPRPEVSVDLLTEADVQAFGNIIREGIDSQLYLTQEERKNLKTARSDEYYSEKLGSDDVTLLVAKDKEGNVVGGLESSIQEKNGKKIGYVHQVCVKEGKRRRGVATKMYENLERLMRSRGDIFALMAHVHSANTASLRFHKEMGIKHVFKDEDEKGDWYLKYIDPSME